MRTCCLILLALCISAMARADASRDAAISLYKSKKYPEAREAFTQIATTDPANAEAQFYLGVLAQKRNDTDEAIVRLEKATALEPKNSDYFMELGGAYGDAANKAGLFQKMGFAKKCQDALERAVALNPDNLVARNGLITYYRTAPTFAGGGISKAYEQAEEIRKRDPVIGAGVYAQLYLHEKRIDEAFKAYEDVLQQKPDSYLTLYSLGRTSAQTGQRLDRGEQALQRCLELTPGRGDPSHAAVHWRLGNLAEKKSDSAKARAEYEAALKADPAFTQAQESLSKLK